MTNKELYSEWAATQSRLPIFLQPWWLDAVTAGKEWDVLISKDANGDVRAAMPYLFRKKWWMRWICMPQQTQIGGVWLREDNERITSPSEVRDICADFSSQLQLLKLNYYYQQFPIDSPCVPIMKELGYRVRERVTYRLTDLQDLDVVIDKFSRNKKRQLQKALSLHADFSMTDEQFYDFHQRCMAERKKKITYSREFFLVLYRKLTRNKQGQIVCIKDADNNTLAAAFVVWDSQSMYYLIPCYSPTYKDSGAGALLVLECIKLARQHQVVFDFEGSMSRGTAAHYKQFGPALCHYYSVEKYYRPLFRLVMWGNALRNWKYGI